jgi:hypothetical protein
MKSLVHLLGAGALTVARDAQPTRFMPEPELLPIASTPETAAAWRRWAEAGREAAVPAQGSVSISAARPAPSREPA